MPAKNKGAVQTGKRPKKQYYGVGHARFERAPNLDETGVEYARWLDSKNYLSSAAIIRALVASPALRDAIETYLKEGETPCGNMK